MEKIKEILGKFSRWLKSSKWNVMYCVAILVASVLGVLLAEWSASVIESTEIEEVSYNEFKGYVERGEVDTVYYNNNDQYMTFTLYNDATRGKTKKELEDRKYKYSNKDKRKALYPAHQDFRKELLESGVNLEIKSSPWVISLISFIVSIMIPILWVWFIYRVIMSSSKGSISKKSFIQSSDVRFEDVIGQDEILGDIRFIVDLIRNPDMGNKIGARVPKGILLSGSPGTGKTLIAKAIAGEAGVHFIHMSGSSFKEMWAGLGAKRVRDVFKLARENSPCIIFLDEIDALGSKRDARGSTQEDDQTLNELLVQMDGFNSREGIFVIGATNRPDKLDSALTRAGRFDRKIEVNPPKNWKVRRELFEHYIKLFKVSDGLDLDSLSKQVSGFTGADISAVCNEASLVAMMSNKDCIDRECIEEAIDKQVFKGNRSKVDSYKNDKRIVAYHEAGHAVMTWLLGMPIARASIQSMTSGVGGVVFREDSDSSFVTNRELHNTVLICYAGRASEQIKFGVITSGATNDISQATSLMSKYIQTYGFDDDFGLLDMTVLQQESIIENNQIVSRLSEMSKKLYTECLDLLSKNYSSVELLAEKLLELETMSGDEITDLLKNK